MNKTINNNVMTKLQYKEMKAKKKAELRTRRKGK